MKSLILVPLFLIYYSLVFSQYRLDNPDIAIDPNIEFVDLINSRMILIGDSIPVEMGQKIGKINPFPNKLSKSFDHDIKLSQDYYSNGEFEKAYQQLEKAIKSEPENPFILDAYTRALYQISDKKQESFDNYKRLIALLDDKYGNEPRSIKIDMWFREAYWKLGTLYMDVGEWDHAQYEINRFLMSIQELKGTQIYIQALGYLTECYFELVLC